jgi:AcrR family transcriptional regulator
MPVPLSSLVTVHNGGVATPREPNVRPSGSTQRQHILSTALTLMSQQGVDGTSMRNLAAAAGLNVASLYHYFPSKKDLLVAVLEERGFVDGVAAAALPSMSREPVSGLGDLLYDILCSMLEVEDFVRLMMGEVMRGDDTAFAVGGDLFAATRESLVQWLDGHQPPLTSPEGKPAMARMMVSLLVGIFFEHVAGVLEAGTEPTEAFRVRADEAAAFLEGMPPT